MKDNKGITLIVLVITIIILFIIASVGTYSGLEALKDAKEKTQISEVNMLKQAVVENYTKYETTKNEMYIRGTKVNYSDMQSLVNEINSKKSSKEETISLKVDNYDVNGSTDISEYYYELTADDLNEMELSQLKETFIVNYKTGEVINKDLKVTINGIPLYTYSVKAN